MVAHHQKYTGKGKTVKTASPDMSIIWHQRPPYTVDANRATVPQMIGVTYTNISVKKQKHNKFCKDSRAVRLNLELQYIMNK